MQVDRMKNRRLNYLVGSILVSVGMLVFLLTSISSIAAAPETSSQKTSMIDDTTNDRWRILADMQFGLGSPGVVVLQNKVHVISGFYTPGTGNSSAQGVYDPLTNSWQYLWGIFPMPRSDMVVANVSDKLFAIGGWNADLETVYSFTHRFEPGLSEWITMTSMITPVSGAGSVVISDSIYVIGGFDGITSTAHVQIYNTISDTWSVGTPLPKGRTQLEAVLLDGLIYAIGGNRADGDSNPSTNIVEIYDPGLDSWMDGPPLPDSRASMVAVVRQGKIYVIGGTDNWASSNAVDTTFVYDPSSGAWTTADPMPTARSAIQAAVISDTIYVIGGVGELGAGTANEAYADFEILPSFTRISLDSPDPSQSFQPIVVNYAVTSTIGVPTGVVTVTTNQNALQCSEQPLVDGMGSCEIIFDTPGTYTITATYGGDDFNLGSSDSEGHQVVKAETTISLIEDQPDPSLVGQPISVTFGVTSTYGIPVGTVVVTVSNSLQSCADDLADGVGSCALTLDSQGTYTITASYDGDIAFAPSSGNATHLVVESLKVYIPLVRREE